MAILNDGSLWGWGRNIRGQLGDGTTKARKRPVKILDGVRQVSAGYSHTMAILNDGSLWGWGRNKYGQIGDGTTTDRTRPVKIAEKVKGCSLRLLLHNIYHRCRGTDGMWEIDMVVILYPQSASIM